MSCFRYKFSAQDLPTAHAQNQTRVRTALAQGISPIISKNVCIVPVPIDSKLSVHPLGGSIKVETKIPFSVFANMRKSSENGQIFAKFHEISFREKFSFSRKFRIFFSRIFAKTKNSDFRKNFAYFSRKFSRKLKTPIFAKIFAKMSVTVSKTFANTKISC
jgi:hypothetical protein